MSTGQGTRTDVQALMGNVRAGASLLTLYEEHPNLMLRCHAGVMHARRAFTPKRTIAPKVMVVFGPTGVGKSTVGRLFGPPETTYWLPHAKGSGTYWDDYSATEHDTVVIDEMRGNRFQWGFLLGLLDRNPFSVPIHGGSSTFDSKTIIFTANFHPAKWYNNPFFEWAASPLRRRIDLLIFLPGFDEYRSIPKGTLPDDVSSAVFARFSTVVELRTALNADPGVAAVAPPSATAVVVSAQPSGTSSSPNLIFN